MPFLAIRSNGSIGSGSWGGRFTVGGTGARQGGAGAAPAGGGAGLRPVNNTRPGGGGGGSRGRGRAQPRPALRLGPGDARNADPQGRRSDRGGGRGSCGWAPALSLQLVQPRGRGLGRPPGAKGQVARGN